jgi:hypothetical protein
MEKSGEESACTPAFGARRLKAKRNMKPDAVILLSERLIEALTAEEF